MHHSGEVSKDFLKENAHVDGYAFYEQNKIVGVDNKKNKTKKCSISQFILHEFYIKN